MISSIRILDQHAANQIAAGEVVERPVSVVKELVENSLDAGAKRIDIIVEGNGVPLIQVQDDGGGIRSDELSLAFLRHATSKIRDITDLDNLRSLGFRGEALPSIASVANLEICSRSQDEIAGTCLKFLGGKEIEKREIGRPLGTTVSVRDLFFNTPARKKFLRSTNTEFGLISDTIGRLALARPDVAFTLTHPRQIVLQTPGRSVLLETIGAVIGTEMARRLIPVDQVNENWHLKGFVSPPEIVRTNRQAQTFIVNGRIIRSAFLSRAVEEGYHTLIPGKFHPVVILHLNLPPNEYDVNVHPTKMDIRFEKEKDLAVFIQDVIRETLKRNRLLPDFFLPAGKPTNEFPGQRRPLPPPKLTPKPTSEPEQISRPAQPVKTQILFQYPDNSHEKEVGAAQLEPENIQLSEFLNPTEFVKETIAQVLPQSSSTNAKKNEILEGPLLHFNFWPLAQVFRTYILATDGEALFLIDQHAAHERINYEHLLRQAKQNNKVSQNLLIPIPMEFTVQEEQILLEHLWALTEMGFVLEQFGPKTYLLRAVPAQAGKFSADELLRQFIAEVLQQKTPPEFDRLLEEWIYLLACKNSIKAKEQLSLPEMEQLLAQLNKTENPYTCPHGRPTIIKISRSEIEKRFYRS